MGKKAQSQDTRRNSHFVPSENVLSGWYDSLVRDGKTSLSQFRCPAENNEQHQLFNVPDIDAVLEFNNDVLILMEVKYRRRPIPTGQRLLLERIVDSWHTDRSCALKVEHDFTDDDENIPLHTCLVTGFYNRRHWVYYKDPVPLVDYLNELGEKWDCKKCKF